MAFKDDLDADNDNVFFQTTDVEFAETVTFTRVDTDPDTVTASVPAVVIELLFSVFDPKQQRKVFIPDDALGGYEPRPGDKITTSDGFKWDVLNVLKEVNVFNMTIERLSRRN